MAPRAATRLRDGPDPGLIVGRLPDHAPNTCGGLEQAEATMEAARALHRIADGLEALSPAAETVHGMGDRLDKLCTWLKAKGPWILASIPIVLTAINAMSPEAAKGLTNILSALGAAQ